MKPCLFLTKWVWRNTNFLTHNLKKSHEMTFSRTANANVDIFTKFLSLAVQKVAKMTTSSATSDENFMNMTFTFYIAIFKGRNKYLRPTDTVECNYLSLPLILASGIQVLNIMLWCITMTLLYLLICIRNIIDVNPLTTGNTWMHTQHCGCWCPGVQAPGHQYP